MVSHALSKLVIITKSYDHYIALLLLGVITYMLFLISPTGGDFSWSDAPRHALNGIFVKDLIFDLPSNPKQYAINYYLQYPALTILFYPPLMSLFMAGFYAMFGFSHQVAQASITVFLFLLAVGVYLLARRWLPTWQAFSASVLLVGAPEVAFWALQVMLDIPAYAWLTFSALVFLQYLDNGKIRDLYLAMILMLCALYTKQNVVFAVVVFALLMLKVRGVLVLKERHVWQAIILFAIGLTPLLYLLSEFGQVNLSSVSGARDGDLGWTTLDAWTFYLREMPGQLGWPTFILGFSFIVGMAVRPSWRLPNRQDGLLLVGWLLIGYVFFSFIALKIPRHNLTALLPMVLFAVLFLNRTLTRFGQRYASTAAVILAFGTFAYTLFFQPIPYVKGYAEAAHLVSELAPEKSVVLFSGIRDGNFVFNVRANTDRKDLSVLRADKLLLRFAIERERGFEDRGLGDKNTLHDLFNRHAVHYVVAQTDFWIDSPSMRSLQDLLQDNSHFEIVRRLKVKANIHVDDQELVIYRNLGKVVDTPSSISLEMVGIGQTFNGKFGNE